MTSDSGVIDRDSGISHGSEPLDREPTSSGDSSFLGKQSSSPRLQVYEAGRKTVVGFGGRDVPSDYCIAESRQFLARLVRENACQELTFDLSGVRLIPSGMLGVIASMRNLGVAVSVCNPSDDVREVFETTQLKQIIRIRDNEA